MLLLAILLGWCLLSLVLGLGIGYAITLSDRRRPRLRRGHFESAA